MIPRAGLSRFTRKPLTNVYGSTRPAGAAPVFSQQAAPGGTAGVPYSYTFVASGSPTHAIGSGSITGSGLTLASNGVLSGATPVAGTYTFTDNATNGAGTTPSVSQTVIISAGGTFTDIPVTPSGSASIVVGWKLPTSNADGSAISPAPTWQRVRVALASGFLTGVYPFEYYINDFATISKTINNLVSGTTYYYVVDEFANGDWSEVSAENSVVA